jgi:DNA polymerase/3'-5' exonuclease PolX
MELECTSQYRMWACRKAAWVLEDLTKSVAEIYVKNERNGFENLKDVGKTLVEEIERRLQEISETGEHTF